MRLYTNPVHGLKGIAYSDYPAQLTRAQVIEICADHAIGTCKSIENQFEGMIEYLAEETGEDFSGFDFWKDLSQDELEAVDDIVGTCACCGWNYDGKDLNVIDDELICPDCERNLEEEEDIDFEQGYDIG